MHRVKIRGGNVDFIKKVFVCFEYETEMENYWDIFYDIVWFYFRTHWSFRNITFRKCNCDT